MFHFTLFGGSEVKLDGSSKLVVTMFGGTDLHRQTLAKRIMREKQLAEHEARLSREHNTAGLAAFQASRRARNTAFVLTMFGAVEIKPPSLTEEFMDMRELIASGLVSESEWDQLVGRLYESGDQESCASLTMFGSLEDSKLSEDEELKKIKSAQELGILTPDEELALRAVVGRDANQVRMLLRQTAFDGQRGGQAHRRPPVMS